MSIKFEFYVDLENETVKVSKSTGEFIASIDGTVADKVTVLDAVALLDSLIEQLYNSLLSNTDENYQSVLERFQHIT